MSANSVPAAFGLKSRLSVEVLERLWTMTFAKGSADKLRWLSAIAPVYILRPMPMIRLIGASIGTGMVIFSIFGQVPPVQMKFEVVSVKLHRPPASGASIHRIPAAVPFHISGNRVNEELVTAQELIMDAYDIKEFQVSGVPPWAEQMGGDHYDIVAKTEGTAVPSVAQVRLMLQSVLTDRFQFRVHHETRELPVYELVIAEGKSKLKEVRVDPSAGGDARASSGVSMTAIVRLLSLYLDRPVIDKTGMTGEYEMGRMDWNAMYHDAGAVMLASEENWGLKLEPRKANIEMLVVDHLEKPSGN